jgi:hypothetical protein
LTPAPTVAPPHIQVTNWTGPGNGSNNGQIVNFGNGQSYTTNNKTGQTSWN